MTLGENVLIERDCWIQTVPGPTSDHDAKISIGANSAIGMGSCISAAARIALGEFVLTGRNIYISDHAHAFEDITRPIACQGITGIAPVSIGRHTWLGQNVVVLPGVNIGEHCVIGANSVVNNSIPDGCVAVGAPARVVKRYNRDSRLWEKI